MLTSLGDEYLLARSGLTAELLSGFAAVSLIAVYNALCYMKHTLTDVSVNWHVVDATFAVGALGFVGLTVWNLRVESTVHTCFTCQTIMAVFIQVATLTAGLNTPQRSNWVCLAVMAAAMLEYVLVVIILPVPNVSDPDYFDAKYYVHAWGQFVFFASYFVALTLIVEQHCTPRTLRGDYALANRQLHL